jgi:hypothetical protein
LNARPRISTSSQRTTSPHGFVTLYEGGVLLKLKIDRRPSHEPTVQ